MSGVRNDVQVLRGLAIIAVVAFHFFPSVFPNGYLGVDQFFVISGFLMCMLLKKSENSCWYARIGNFYYRRMKRILPLYQLIILATLVIARLLLTPSGVDLNLSTGQQALLFVSNYPHSTEAKDYFNELSHARNFFTHTWSLSVEVQFYFIVPFIFLLTERFSRERQILAFAIISITSVLFQIFTTSPEVSFNNVISRIWQFMLGMIAYLQATNYDRVQNEDENCIVPLVKSDPGSSMTYKDTLKTHANLILLIPIAITTYSTPINSSIARILVTCLTTLFICVSSESIIPFENVLVFTSNISYALYLVHWPIYAFWKVINISSGIDEVEALNHKWHKNDFIQLGIPGSETWIGKHYRMRSHQNGFKKFMIVGSSTLANIAPLIQDECGIKAKELIQLTFPGCEPLYPTERIPCIQRLDEFHQTVRDERPDYLFIGGRFSNMGNPLSANMTNLDYDQVLAVARDQLQKYMAHVSQKIVMVHAFPRPSIPNIERLGQFFRSKLTFQEIDKLLTEPVENGYAIARQRYEALLKECDSKCDVIDYTSIFANTTTNFVRYFDNIGLSYFTLGLHLTPLGLEIVRPIVTQICKNL